jgi:hypothetical protein
MISSVLKDYEYSLPITVDFAEVFALMFNQPVEMSHTIVSLVDISEF